MKLSPLYLSRCAFASALLLVPTVLPAQVVESKSTTTTTTMGTVNTIGPDTIIVRSETSPDPLRYSFSESTSYVDETGQTVTRETIRSGAPVTIHYTRDGDRMLARKVVVRKSATARAPGAVTETSTSETTTLGTIGEFGPESFTVRTKTTTEPVRYRFSESTTYVDESGAPVVRTAIRAGTPITVHYSRDGDRMIARKVIVRKSTDGPAVEKREVERTETETTKIKKDD